jgi:deazaflavin-dependent oxidoreductase (nitroreductase family)
MALIYGRSGDDYLLVASDGGAHDHPQWFKNLRKHPDVELQVRDEVFFARAREATDEEKPAMWQEMLRHWPAYDRYQKKTDRPIPVVVLERAA